MGEKREQSFTELAQDVQFSRDREIKAHFTNSNSRLALLRTAYGSTGRHGAGLKEKRV
jgi:hypothetical protein